MVRRFRKPTIRSLSLGFLLIGIAKGQNTPTNQRASYSNCANIVALAGDVKINCSSLTPEQKKMLGRIPNLLNQLLVKQLDPDVVMPKLEEILEAARSGKNPYKPVVTYEPSGLKHIISPGVFNSDEKLLSVGASADVLMKAEDWKGLINLADTAHSTDPDWFSLDYMYGIAKLHLCQKSRAVEALTKFVSETTDAPNYGAQRNTATRLLDESKSFQYSTMCPIAP